ncbi:MAG TPA: hypothetical protein HPQ03_12095 [Deltaproteobacteria bacterium]|nr:hypothetical protein [Deltaproteobacteria bacterium]
MKRIGVIGPTNTSLIESKINLPNGTIESAAGHLGKFLAENSFALVSVPARGVGLWVLESYNKAKGPDALALTPYAAEQSKEYADKVRRNAELAHRVRDDLTWGDEPFELAKACDCLVALGLSCGTLVEMIATKWQKGPPIYAVAAFMSQIPAEVLAEIKVIYFERLEELEAALSTL